MHITREPRGPATHHEGALRYVPAHPGVPGPAAARPATGPAQPAPTGPPQLLRRRDGVLPAVAAALSVRGTTTVRTGCRATTAPALHPLVAGFLAALPVARRSRGTGRCPEVLLLSRFLTDAERSRRGRAARRPFTGADARRALRDAVVTTRAVRAEGDPGHGRHTPPCAACADLLEHFGVTADPAADQP